MAATSTNYIQHFNSFIEISQKDKRLTGNHISLYVALFSIWNQAFFVSPFKLIRAKALRISHIGSCHTYNKCMKDLESFGYINRFRSLSNGKPGSVIIVMLAPIVIRKNAPPGSAEIEPTDSKSAPPADANMLHYINNTNSINKGRGNAPPLNKNNNKQQEGNINRPEDLDEVKVFFHLQNYPESEAAKFFHHYEANGWKQGGKVPITNWLAAAQKWILNIHPTQPQKNGKPGNLHINQNKSYSDPL